ncbi:FCD domain protein [Bordetella bronchiseptica 980-2]|nr:FCD domain protein [Bordetella bronchiseptica MO211]KAK68861.1 FCD domain protein [Bordetella bronchiseptica 980-2]KAK69990.1 FCD domain protein [Bordetella bronchiseptica CA90 BB02]KCV48457.1 FCD domain protein [Bordetella bronchiseptica 3E44]KCV59792.1 FCD domain protein [Bordetella bronchiseptica 980]KDB69098.1 FCD domain protein [Bordetella bronchiseptica A1-7]KDB74805.1 FCD domain protein [Bordetella bronchiseptica CA90 BB1334]KDB82901.1 FCD domain protein [Bordetella bronchiseptica 
MFAVIRDKLRERILSGEFTPGDRLIEGRLSDDMGVSRIPVREALRALAAEGLVTIEPRRGASVAVLSEAIAYDMVEVRATLEGLNAKLAAQRRDDATVTRLRKFLDDGTEAARSDDLQQFLALNSQFHEMLATIAGNVVLTDLMRSLRDRTALLFAPSNMRRAKQNWDEHAQILNAVIAGNGELASLLATQHVHNAARAYTEAQQQNQPSAA